LFFVKFHKPNHRMRLIWNRRCKWSGTVYQREFSNLLWTFESDSVFRESKW